MSTHRTHPSHVDGRVNATGAAYIGRCAHCADSTGPAPLRLEVAVRRLQHHVRAVHAIDRPNIATDAGADTVRAAL